MKESFLFEVEAEIKYMMRQFEPAFRKKFGKRFRLDSLRTACIEHLIELKMVYLGCDRNIALWHLRNKNPRRMPFTTKHPDYDRALKKHTPLNEKIQKGTLLNNEPYTSVRIAHDAIAGQYELQLVVAGLDLALSQQENNNE